jgi:hypothetical protein
MLVISPSSLDIREAGKQRDDDARDDRRDVRRAECGCTRLTPCGSRRSALIEKKMRG